jgi:hypothetical protein
MHLIMAIAKRDLALAIYATVRIGLRMTMVSCEIGPSQRVTVSLNAIVRQLLDFGASSDTSS